MGDIAIRVKNLSKQYCIGQKASYHTIRDAITNAARVPFKAIRSSKKDDSSYFWALKDVSFEVEKGEVVGIIGRNGAGKSTLLKILSRITEPTEGCAEIYGQVGSLLEVGTGFHPELTGRENIYLSGAILGMKKTEIDCKFDEIIKFSETEKFLDTPLKHYSSGMQVRLGFAVAAHLEPEILIIDEVLAVGDAAFQKKCLGKMNDVAKEGRTVLFVSHNMAAILNLCSRAILIKSGKIIGNGDCESVVNTYLNDIDAIGAIPLAERQDRKGNQALKFISYKLVDSIGNTIQNVSSGHDIAIILKYISNTNLKNVHVAMGIHGKFDENLFHLSTSTTNEDIYELPTEGSIICKISNLPLQPGKYHFNLFCMVNGEISDWIQNAGIIEVDTGDYFGTGKLPPEDQGPFLVKHGWSFTKKEWIFGD